MDLFEFAARGARAQAEVNMLCNQPLARDTDPITSHEAADKMVKSGALNRQENLVFDIILRYNKAWGKDFTTKDIAIRMTDYPYHKAYDICRKRFSGLANKGKIELVKYKVEIPPRDYIIKDKKRDGCRVWRLI